MHPQKSRRIKLLLGPIFLIPFVMISPLALAGGIKLPVQNVTNLGLAYAGAASLAEDASTNYYNSAGLVRLEEEQIVFGATLNLPQTKINVTSATTTIGRPLSPASGHAIPTNSALVPLFHYAKRINENWLFGFSSVTVFGARTNYLDNSIVRYMATRSELRTVDLGPSIAYDFNNGLSIGAGVNALHAFADISSSIGTGNIDTDGRFNVTASNWGIGYHAGALYQFNHCTRLGLNYQSKIDVKLKGESATQLATGLPIFSQKVRSTIHLPDYVTLSFYHALCERWSIMMDVQYIRWNRFKKIDLKFENDSRIITQLNYKNSYFVAVGTTYQINDCWQFKLGTAYDKTPTRDDTRQLYNPDQDQIYAATGLQYRFSRCLAFEFAYIHLFYKKPNFNVTAPIAVNTVQGRQSVYGHGRNQMNVLGFQVTWDLM